MATGNIFTLETFARRPVVDENERTLRRHNQLQLAHLAVVAQRLDRALSLRALRVVQLAKVQRPALEHAPADAHSNSVLNARTPI